MSAMQKQERALAFASFCTLRSNSAPFTVIWSDRRVRMSRGRRDVCRAQALLWMPIQPGLGYWPALRDRRALDVPNRASFPDPNLGHAPAGAHLRVGPSPLPTSGRGQSRHVEPRPVSFRVPEVILNLLVEPAFSAAAECHRETDRHLRADTRTSVLTIRATGSASDRERGAHTGLHAGPVPVAEMADDGQFRPVCCQHVGSEIGLGAKAG